MKTAYGMYARRIAAVVMCVCLAMVAGRTQADVVNMNHRNSTAVFDSASGGLTQWTVDGVECLGFEGLWIALPGQAESPLTVASAATLFGPESLEVIYNDYFGVSVDLAGDLTGGLAGSGVSHFTELITVKSPTAVTVRLLQYCDFGASAGLEQAEMMSSRLVELDVVHEGDVALNSPPVSHFQIGSAADLLTSLNDGAVTVLTDNVGPVVGNELAWVLQWDLELAANGTAMISRPKGVGPALTTIVPEPCTMSVMALASAALLARRRRKA